MTLRTRARSRWTLAWRSVNSPLSFSSSALTHLRCDRAIDFAIKKEANPAPALIYYSISTPATAHARDAGAFLRVKRTRETFRKKKNRETECERERERERERIEEKEGKRTGDRQFVRRDYVHCCRGAENPRCPDHLADTDTNFPRARGRDDEGRGGGRAKEGEMARAESGMQRKARFTSGRASERASVRSFVCSFVRSLARAFVPR